MELPGADKKLAEENQRLKQELERALAELQALRLRQQQEHAPPVLLATDPAGHTKPAPGPEPNSKPGAALRDSASGLRLRPLFQGDKCVEIVAQVVPDIKHKRRKHKKHGTHTHSKGKNKARPYGQKRRPLLQAQLDAAGIVGPVVPATPGRAAAEQLVAGKRLVRERLGKLTGLKEVSEGATLEQLLAEQAAKGTDSAFFLVNLGAVVEKLVQWRAELPEVEPFYAIKSNPDINIVRTLALLGASFDCASKAEIEEVLGVGVPPARIIFANPCKGLDHIRFARERGVDLMTFDNDTELRKIAEVFPAARLVLRVLADDSYSLCPFGTKFGASRAETTSLIVLAKELRLSLVGVSFHVGSSCQAAVAWAEALRLARHIFDEAAAHGMRLSLCDMGGGWPGTDKGKLTFPAIAAELRPVLRELFPPESGVRLIAEPGRFFCTSAYTLAVTINSKRERWRQKEDPLPAPPADGPVAGAGTGAAHQSGAGAPPPYELSADKHLAPPGAAARPVKEVLYYLSEGLYGSFNNCVFDHAVPAPYVMRSPSPGRAGGAEAAAAGGAEGKQRSCLFGPTCDSIDVVVKDIMLPDLHVGDWLYFLDMGAYTVASASTFNGFRPPNAVYWMTAGGGPTPPELQSPSAPAAAPK